MEGRDARVGGAQERAAVGGDLRGEEACAQVFVAGSEGGDAGCDYSELDFEAGGGWGC